MQNLGNVTAKFASNCECAQILHRRHRESLFEQFASARIETLWVAFDLLSMMRCSLGGKDSPEGLRHVRKTRRRFNLVDSRTGARKLVRRGFHIRADFIVRFVE